MSAWVPTFTLWNDTGVTKLYTFPLVQYTNAPQSVKDLIKISNHRGLGEIIIDGGSAPWELEIRFILTGDDYTEIASAIDDLENTIALNTPYLILIDKSISTFYQYQVKRLTPFEYTGTEEDLRNNIQRVTARFDVGAW